MVTSLLSQKCTVIKQVATTDSVGRPAYARTVVHENLPCRIDTVRLRSAEQPEPGAAQSILRNVLYTEDKSDITADMQVELDGLTYNVVSINRVRGGATYHHLQLEINRVENV